MPEPITFVEAMAYTMATIALLSGGLGLLALLADACAHLPRRRRPVAARPLPATPAERAAREVH